MNKIEQVGANVRISSSRSYLDGLRAYKYMTVMDRYVHARSGEVKVALSGYDSDVIRIPDFLAADLVRDGKPDFYGRLCYSIRDKVIEKIGRVIDPSIRPCDYAVVLDETSSWLSMSKETFVTLVADAKDQGVMSKRNWLSSYAFKSIPDSGGQPVKSLEDMAACLVIPLVRMYPDKPEVDRISNTRWWSPQYLMTKVTLDESMPIGHVSTGE